MMSRLLFWLLAFAAALPTAAVADSDTAAVDGDQLQPFLMRDPEDGALRPADELLKEMLLAPPQQECDFPALKSRSDFAIYATGAHSGRAIQRQIDQSGSEATQIDVLVNSPEKPVALLLGAYSPTLWNIGWTRETTILAVYVSGYHRQAVAGLPKNMPLHIHTHDNKSPCGYFYISSDKNKLEVLNPLARKIFGRPVETFFQMRKGMAMVGEAPRPESRYVNSSAVTLESFYINSPLAGKAGLEDAVRKGILRGATQADYTAWEETISRHAPPKDIPPVVDPQPPRSSTRQVFPGNRREGYVVLKAFTYPAGLYGGNSTIFFVPRGVPLPQGNPGHSAVYDFNALSCTGARCP
ncbi:MAG: hypothetical protein LBP52_06705 [Burkholderiaceae bacterium]|jgi:hypothetical protein|nr:hypothetical protein [Burkholderiaceae bacterium]